MDLMLYAMFHWTAIQVEQCDIGAILAPLSTVVLASLIGAGLLNFTPRLE